LALVVGLGLVGWFLHFPLRLVGLVGLLSLLFFVIGGDIGKDVLNNIWIC
jgi:hypothetical protein